MTVVQLPDPGMQVLEQVAAARAAVTTAADVGLANISTDLLAASIRELAALQSQAEALRMAIATEADRRRAADDDADTGTDAWLAKLTGERREQARGGLRLAARLQDAYPATLTALGAGEIRLEHARVIVDGLDLSIDDATPEQRAQAEELLINKASGVGNRSGRPMSVPLLRRAVRRIYATIDADLSARHLARSLKANRQRGTTNTWMTLADNGDGTFVGRFQIPELHGSLLRTVVEHLSSPRRLSLDQAGTEIWDETAGGPSSGLSWTDKLGRAFCELLEHLPLDRLAASPVTMLVRLDLDTLTAGTGVGETSTGIDLDPGDVRRLACEAGIVPAVMGGASVPLDLGRTRRLFTDKHRQALGLTYDSCAIVGCDRPFAWTELHHLKPWSAGGRTDLKDALPVCGHHHRAIHDGRYELVRHDETQWILRRIRRRT